MIWRKYRKKVNKDVSAMYFIRNSNLIVYVFGVNKPSYSLVL